MHSEPGSPHEIKSLIPSSKNWNEAVVYALKSNDTASLGELYRHKVRELGSVKATQDWLEIVSGWDATASTG